MKRCCVPLRADHELLLTPDTQHTLSGVRRHPVVQLRSIGVASLLRDLPGPESAVGSSRRRPVTSPTRRLRFEDETETEAESRYLDRQRQRTQMGVLASKPDLNLYVNGRPGAHGHQGPGLQGPGLQGSGAHGHQGTGLQGPRLQGSGAHGHQETGPQGPGGHGHQGARPASDGEHRGRTAPWDSCGTVLGGRVSLKPCPHPEDRGRSPYRPRLSLWSEPIRETYIGSVTACDRSGGGGKSRSTNQNMPNTNLPINPYPPQQLATPLSRSFSSPQSVRLNSTQAEQTLNHNQSLSWEELGGSAAKPHHQVTERNRVDPKSQSSETTAESQAPPPSGSSDGQVKQPMRAEVYSDYTSHPERVSREEPAGLSLRRLFSSVRLSTTRTGSLDRLRSRPRRSESDPAPPESAPAPLEYDHAPSGLVSSSSLLRKTPSVQSLSLVSPFLRRSSSVQSFLSEQKKKKKQDRSADYRPAADHCLQRCLNVKDVGRPSSVRPVGRVLQVSADGSILLELSQSESSRLGIIISRGRGRGVYVEDMVDSGTEKLYAGLLAVGDEILEVNGAKVACLSLDQVTQLLTEKPSATVRLLRHRRTPPR
ncbi:uncharacterized protein LOC116677028 [Etheostoma spectabile]|uniref:uncharacterized protein LOC116677028 n=1 Tax=Etheostoma spectabile TaxID=54343 RepID=UPI0013AFE9ED|nr:uncharacterized protein LOC116677028 [Etheostoma spectabile]